MRRAKGATLAEIMKATGWQAHTVRGFVSGTLIQQVADLSRRDRLQVVADGVQMPARNESHRLKAVALVTD